MGYLYFKSTNHIYTTMRAAKPYSLPFSHLESIFTWIKARWKAQITFQRLLQKRLACNRSTNLWWESFAADSSKWKYLCSKALRDGEKQLSADAEKKRERRRADSGICFNICEICNRIGRKSRQEVH